MKNGDLDCTVPGAHSIEQIDELFEAGTFTEDDDNVLRAMTAGMKTTGAQCQLSGQTGQAGAWD